MTILAAIVLGVAIGRFWPLKPRSRVPRNAARPSVDSTAGVDVEYTGREEWPLQAEGMHSTVGYLLRRDPYLTAADAERIINDNLTAELRRRGKK